MTRVTQLRLAAALIGVIIWAYAYRADDNRLRWIGIAFLALALLFRFAEPRRPRRRPPDE